MTPYSSFPAAVARDGFAILPGVIEAAELDALVQNLQRSQLPRSRAGVRHAMRDLNVATVAGDERLLELARGVLGAAAFPFRATLFDKSPDSNWLVVWHQDTALPLRERCDMPGWGPWSVKERVNYAHAPANALEQVLALRLHLDDSSADNGPLRVLPGTHTLGVLSDKQLHDLSTELTSVDCLAPGGGVIAMRPLAIHASSKSQSERPRRVLHIEYAATPILDNGLELAIV